MYLYIFCLCSVKEATAAFHYAVLYCIMTMKLSLEQYNTDVII